MKAPGYISINHPSLSRFYAYIPYFGSHLARFDLALLERGWPETHPEASEFPMPGLGSSTSMVSISYTVLYDGLAYESPHDIYSKALV